MAARAFPPRQDTAACVDQDEKSPPSHRCRGKVLPRLLLLEGGRRRAIVVGAGAGQLGTELRGRFANDRALDVDVAGFFDDRTIDRTELTDPKRLLGKLTEIPDLSRIALAQQILWSRRTVHKLDEMVAAFRLDVIHVHNTFPLISPSLYWAAEKAGVPVVQTLHNFRLLCPQAMLLRGGRVCEDCVGRLPWRGVVRACYRGAMVQPGVLGAMLVLHRSLGTWQNKVTRYIALNEFCRAKFIEGGLPAVRIAVKPNFVDLPAPPVMSRSGALFVGHLSPEKGIDALTEAARQVPELDVAIIGSGPEEHRRQGLQNVRALGFCEPDAVRAAMYRAGCLVMPSIWYENSPRTLVEAFACGLPVVASRLGALADLIRDGETRLLFEPGNAADLAAKLRWAVAHPAEMARMGQAARAEDEANYTADINYRQLMAIYDEAIQASSSSDEMPT